MALTLSTSQLGIKGKYRTAWRVIFVALSLSLLTGFAVAWFLFVPVVNASVKAALAEGGIIFVVAVIVPSGIVSAVTIAWGIRLMWRVSGEWPENA